MSAAVCFVSGVFVFSSTAAFLLLFKPKGRISVENYFKQKTEKTLQWGKQRKKAEKPLLASLGCY